ncbi:MAG: undecaprenyl-diphosphate phosphatase [Christensenellales bacterium]|jgi:undecaprenyl-diphosphatase
MSVFHAALLGLVQGLCEFLPVSSSGHLVLLQNIFGIAEGALFFDTMLHLGTLFAVVFAFRKTLWEMIRHPFRKYPMFIVLATVPAVVFTLLFRDFIEGSYSGSLLGWGFLVTALLLTVTDRLSARVAGKRRIDGMRAGHALLIGAAQGLAVFPGVSRSGSTISGGLFCSLEREFAAEFAFMMSIPAILGATVLQVKDVLEVGIGSVDWIPVLVGMAVAFVSGLFAIRWMMKIVKKGKLGWFALYTAILGVLVLIDRYATHLFF